MEHNLFIPVGCDAGNGVTKVFVNGRIHYIDTIVHTRYEPRLVYGGGDRGNPVDYLDVSVESGTQKGDFFVGSLAARAKSGSIESLGGDKCTNEMLRVAMLTSIAYALAVEYPEQLRFNIALGAGLPAGEFFYKNSEGKYVMEKVKKYRKTLAGIHKVKFNSNLFKKKTITLEFREDVMVIMPEGYAALMAILYDETGKSLYPEYTKKNKTVIGLDIGGGSSDVSGICNGTYVPEAMFGIDEGINKALDRVCETVIKRANLSNFTRYELNQYLFDEELNGMLETNQETIDLNREKELYYKIQGEKIAHEFKRKLKASGLDFNMIHGLFLLGGGGDELGDIVINHLREDIPNIHKARDKNARDYRALNAITYFHSVKKLLDKKMAGA